MGAQPQDTKRLLGAELRGLADPFELVKWADRALVDGFDSPSLLRLAGMARVDRAEVRHEEVAPEFFRSLGELGVPVPSRELAIRWHLEALAKQIYNGEITPKAGIDRIHSEVVTPLNHPEDLRPWCSVWAGIPLDGPPPKSTNAVIFALAASFLASNSDADESSP